MTFDDFKEGFVAVLSQAIEQLSSSEDEEQPSDSTAGVESNLNLLNYFLSCTCKRQPCRVHQTYSVVTGVMCYSPY